MKFLKNEVKEKLKKGQVVFGTWVHLPSMEIVEILASHKPDFIVIDIEHSSIGSECIQQMIIISESRGVLPFVRVDQNIPAVIKKVLDMGAYGIIVPMIESLSQAQQVIDNVFYPPKGKRGVGLTRAQDYGMNLEKYSQWHQENIVVILQVESANIFSDLSQILQLRDIDATLIGPYDLSASLGVPGNLDHPRVKEALTNYETLSKEYKKPFGYHVVHPSQEIVKEKIQQGYTFLAYGTDEILLAKTFKEEMQKLRDLVRF